MLALEAIRNRRSIRRYRPDPVPREVLGRVLEAARLAPSAYNIQPWRLVVVTDPEKRRAIADLCPRGKFLSESPVVIVGVSDPRASPQFHVIDLSIALENLAIAATAEGLGTCWIGLFDEPKLKELLGIPEELKIVALMALGYPAKVPPPKPKKSLDELVSFEAWRS